MNDGLKTLFAAVAGAAVGSAVTWYLIKTKYEQIAQEEIDSVIEVYSRKSEKEEKNEESNLKDTYSGMINQLEYASDDENKEKGGSEEMKKDKPHVISPDEFAYSEYEQITLTYYADGILADDITDDVIEDIEGTVGADFKNHFGEYEEDAVYIRNDRLKCDYEINRDDSDYNDVTGLHRDQWTDDE